MPPEVQKCNKFVVISFYNEIYVLSLPSKARRADQRSADARSTRYLQINNLKMSQLIPGIKAESRFLGSVSTMAIACLQQYGTIINVSLLSLTPRGFCLKLSAAKHNARGSSSRTQQMSSFDMTWAVGRAIFNRAYRKLIITLDPPRCQQAVKSLTSA